MESVSPQQKHASPFSVFEIIIVILCTSAGFVLAYPPYGLFGPDILDGACSGGWGPIAWQCYVPDAFYAICSVCLSVIIFRKKATAIAILSASVFMVICLGFGILRQAPLYLFTRSPYVPSVGGVWISIWAVIVTAALIYGVMKFIKGKL